MAEHKLEVDSKAAKPDGLPTYRSLMTDMAATPQERKRNFLDKTGGRYSYLDGDIVVDFSYADAFGEKLERKLAEYASSFE